jgi:UDP-3-O-[3-hydroxymyristoyl] glucosamine N-acyltransferase LpxD
MNSQEIAKFLNLPIIGNKIEINGVSDLLATSSNKVKYVDKLFSGSLEVLNNNINNLLIVSKKHSKDLNVRHIVSNNPRLDFIRITNKYFAKNRINKFENTSVIGTNVKLGYGIYIGYNSVIGDNVIIGNNVAILNNVVISDNVKIGSGSVVKSGSVIGEKGFSFERDESNTPLPATHYGSVVIGDSVEVGACNTIACGTFNDTEIGDFVKTDDQVHIAHNAKIGSKTLICACTEISGSVKIGEGCWIGPNVSIINGITIEDNAFIGIGSLVTSNVTSGRKIMGLESISLKKLLCFKKKASYGL